ncbi:MAG: hypothetical protein QME74_05560, partial [Candidatus Edwardsbacteria bacterium]|nr:hypothetical protein [Candidatus Edwardsbacteria bacterium]
MACTHIEKYLREHPDGKMPDEAAAHLRGCAGCRALYREMTGLDALLAVMPPAALPPYFHARLQVRMRAASKKPRFEIRPVWVPLAAAAAGLVLVFFSSVKLLHDPARVARRGGQDQPETSIVQPAPRNPNVAHNATKGTTLDTRIYPVWPADQDVVAGEDLTITASF